MEKERRVWYASGEKQRVAEEGEQPMQVYSDDGIIRIRSMAAEDARILYETYLSYGWHPQPETYERYFADQQRGSRLVFIAEYRGEV